MTKPIAYGLTSNVLWRNNNEKKRNKKEKLGCVVFVPSEVPKAPDLADRQAKSAKLAKFGPHAMGEIQRVTSSLAN